LVAENANTLQEKHTSDEQKFTRRVEFSKRRVEIFTRRLDFSGKGRRRFYTTFNIQPHGKSLFRGAECFLSQRIFNNACGNKKPEN
jgi:hypothetical protein